MTIKYQPQGILISSSLAINAKFADAAISSPPSASFASHSLGPAGPSGSQYKIIIGSLQGL